MKKFLKISFKICLLILFIGIISAGVLFVDALSVNINSKKLEGNIYDVRFFDNNDKEITETDILFAKKPEKKLQKHTYNAFIAIEDKRFLEHKGIDIKRIVKAALTNIKTVSFKEGASTISQQLIKNTQLTPKKDIFRKSREIKLALDLERNYTKDEIIDMYLNIIYFGSGCYGIENASAYYFNKPSTELTLNESAALAAIIKAPNYYSPFANYDKMMTRKDVVLLKMYENNLISKEEYQNNKKKDIVLCNTQNLKSEYNDYIRASLNEIFSILNVSEKELKNLNFNIYTYMDKEVQKNLHDIVVNKGFYKDYESTDSAAIILNNNNFSVSAVSLKSKLALDKIIRQPGSAIKPVLVYAPALEYNLITPSTEILDEKTDFGGYFPTNYNNKYFGHTSAGICLAKSLNVPAVKVFNSVGIDKAKMFASRSGINFTPQDNNLGLALGGFSKGINLKDLAASYIPFSNGGLHKKPQYIKMIKDKNGKIIYKDNEEAKQVMRDDTAYLMSHMLKESISSGTANKLSSLNLPLYSKTGTVGNSENNTDAYNITYTADSTFAVWMGGLSEKKLDLKVTGGTYPTFMVKSILENYYKDKKPLEIKKPDSVTECEIDTEYLKRNHIIKLASEMTPEKYTKKELFSIHYIPKEISDCFTMPSVEECDIKYNNNKVIIKFDAKDYLEYEIIRTENNKNDFIVEKISNKEGKIEITDNSISCGKIYQYCIIPKYSNKKINKTIKGKIHMSNKIVVPYRFSPKDDFDMDNYDDELLWDDHNFEDNYDID